MRRLALVLVVLAAALAVSGCATTTFTSTWSPPDARPLDLVGKKVVALVIAGSDTLRRATEDTLAGEITAHGARGVASYTVLPGDSYKDRDAAKARLTADGFAGAVVMRLVDVGEKVTYEPSMVYTPGMWSDPYYGSFWGYYGHGWAGPMYDAPVVMADTIVSVETTVYSLEQDKLVWAGMSETFNPSKATEMVDEIAMAAAAEMRKAGLIK